MSYTFYRTASLLTLILTSILSAEKNNSFTLGLWYVDCENPYPGYISQNEKNLFLEIGANWLIGCGDASEDGYMDFCDATNGKIQLVFLGENYRPNLWHDYVPKANRYPEEWWINGVNNFIQWVHENYAHRRGFWGYGVAHEKPAIYDETYYPGLQYICQRIFDSDPEHKSYICGWPKSSLFDMIEGLNVVIDNYPYIFVSGTPYSGAEFQNTLQNLITQYQKAMDNLRDRDIEWRAGFQTGRWGKWEDGNWVWKKRWPTATEIRCQAYLGLTRGAKGIMYFTYHSGIPYVGEGIEGLLTRGCPREKRLVPIPEDNPVFWYYPFDAVRDLNRDLSIIGPLMLNLYPVAAFTNHDPIPDESFVKEVTGNYIEVGVFKHVELDSRYVMMVNRICNNEDGTPACPQTVTVTVEMEMSNTMYYTCDMLEPDNGWWDVTDDNGYLSFDIELAAGDGRLIRIALFQPYVDYKVESISIIPQNPFEGEDMWIQALIRNVGEKKSLHSFAVHFYVDGYYLGMDWVPDLEPGGCKTVIGKWEDTKQGQHIVEVEVCIDDFDNSNNEASKTFTVYINPYGQPIYDHGKDTGYFIWCDKDTREWHIRWTSGSGLMNFSGHLSLEEGLSFTNLKEVLLEKQDSIWWDYESLNKKWIEFYGWVGEYNGQFYPGLVVNPGGGIPLGGDKTDKEDGFDFQVKLGSEDIKVQVKFDLRIGSKVVDPKLVFIGSQKTHPTVTPFILIEPSDN